jgi:hypothetical protein
MATISSISGAQSAAQSGLAQLRLQQAKRNAEQAEQVARSLQAEAQSAQQNANEAQENARSISMQANLAQANAGQARQGLTMIRSVSQMEAQLTNVVAQVTEKLKIAEPAASTKASTKTSTTPVVNVQGQTTGTVINTTA